MAIEKIDRGLAHAVGILFGVGSTLVIFIIGSLDSLSTGFYAAGVWTGVYLAWNIGIVPQQHWQVVERFGQFYEVKLHGLRFYCMLGLVDTIKAEGDFLERKKVLFEGFSLDFVNGSAPIEAYGGIRMVV